MRDHQIGFYIGVDVQVRRRCPYLILDTDLSWMGSGWLSGKDNQQVSNDLVRVITDLEDRGRGKVAVGIDAPRMGLAEPRQYYWKSGSWQKKTASEKGYGRHCEVVIKALQIANPQWTPLIDQAPNWMLLGFDLFQALRSLDHVYEVFPSASYAQLHDAKHPTVSFPFANFQPGPKDMLDACIGAVTVHEFLQGRGAKVGGGDGMGTIILPAPLTVASSHPVLWWPEKPWSFS